MRCFGLVWFGLVWYSMAAILVMIIYIDMHAYKH